jgi:hypothetical protein
MKVTTLTSAVLLALLGSPAIAEPGLSRNELKAELAEATRTGDVFGGELSSKLNELFPHRYPVVPRMAAEKTRAQVKAELAEAVRIGDSLGGESSAKSNELRPDLYPPVAAAPAKTRLEVKAELVEAIRTGEVNFGGESTSTLSAHYPEHYRAVARMGRSSLVAEASRR